MLNSYFADFKQVGYFADFEQVSYWHKNIISYFADFEQDKKNASYFANFEKKMLVILLTDHLKSIPINWIFKVSPWFWTGKPFICSLLL